MKRKISISTTVTLVLLAMALTITLTMLLAMRHFNSQLQQVSERQKMYSHIDDVDKIVREYYDDIDEELLRQGIAQGYIYGIDDPYAAYYPTEQYEAESLRMAGKAKNTGIVLGEMKNVITGAIEVVVSQVYTGSDADRAGVIKGDVVVTINGEPAESKKLADWQTLLDTAASVDMTVRRGEGSSSYVVKKDEYDVLSVQSMLLEHIGYIKITAFYENTSDQFKDAVEFMLEQDVHGLVFDLRNNVGGSSKAVQDMLSQVMPLGAYGTMTDTKGTVTNLSAKVSKALTVPTVTLVNATTAGEAEFFAGALQEAALTTVMGQLSAGKAKYQQYFVLEQSYSALKLTVGEYGLIKGGSWEGEGIVPSIEVVLPPEQEENQMLSPYEDAQVQAAVDKLEESIDQPGVNPDPPVDDTTTTTPSETVTTLPSDTNATESTGTTASDDD